MQWVVNIISKVYELLLIIIPYVLILFDRIQKIPLIFSKYTEYFK